MVPSIRRVSVPGPSKRAVEPSLRSLHLCAPGNGPYHWDWKKPSARWNKLNRLWFSSYSWAKLALLCNFTWRLWVVWSIWKMVLSCRVVQKCGELKSMCFRVKIRSHGTQPSIPWRPYCMLLAGTRFSAVEMDPSWEMVHLKSTLTHHWFEYGIIYLLVP